MNENLLGLSWVAWGAVALLVAGLFALLVPSAERLAATSPFRYVVLRWLHSGCWLLLAASCFLRAGGPGRLDGGANLLAAAAGISYVMFIAAVVSK